MSKKMVVENNGIKEHGTRSLVKTPTYRILIVILDFIFIYTLTGKYEIAFWFMIVSNIYTSIAYYAHERFWNTKKWGLKQ
jgi:uncharacterized membrane protein